MPSISIPPITINSRDWKSIHRQYGYGQALYIAGNQDQGNYSFNFRLNYHQKDGALTFSWNNDRNNLGRAKFDPSYVGKIYNPYTVLQLELPYLKKTIEVYSREWPNTLLHFFARKTPTGNSHFDKLFQTTATQEIISEILPQLYYLQDEALGRSLQLTTNYEDAVTEKFYLRIRINKLLQKASTIENLLHHTTTLVNKLERFAKK
ncbi:hypothetical protein [Chitinophaga eiseniae]|uniref:Uncharacterized protein n=1 Tax=Chitinophaga eiseniae TaxID=634771 RepID=A0A847SAB1_9BACT|nr:hypothetical protein [Chitinophaga eiseniae]NLR78751.1 hypothetical protein [Chitinophaga eiseniae]